MKNIELSTENLIIFGKVILAKLRRFAPILSVLLIVGIYVFLVLQINQASQQQADDDVAKAQTEAIKRLRLDEESIKKIQQLEDQNVNVQSLFKEARENPFQDE